MQNGRIRGLLPSGALVSHPTKRKEEKTIFYAGYDDERIDKEQIFWSLYPKKFNYSLGGYSHRER
jgi:hypothetical protein